MRTLIALLAMMMGIGVQAEEITVDPDEEFTMGWCVTSSNLTVSLNDLQDRDRFRLIDVLELIWTWESQDETELNHARAAWLKKEFCNEIGDACQRETWEYAGFRDEADWVAFLRNSMSYEKEIWLRAKDTVLRLESLKRQHPEYTPTEVVQ